MAPNEAARQTAMAYCKSISPAFCKTPNDPVAYDLTGFLHETTNLATSVRMTSCEAFTVESRLYTCTGNEAGVGGGVVSGVNVGYCKPIDDWSTTVRAEGSWLCRHDTVMGMNCAGPEGIHETEGPIYFVLATTCVQVGPAGSITQDETSADDSTPNETDQQKDLRRAGEYLTEQYETATKFVEEEYKQFTDALDNILKGDPCVQENLDRFNNAVKDWEHAVYQDWSKPVKDLYNVSTTVAESVVTGTWGEIKQVASDLYTETANNQPVTALTKAGPKIAAALFGGGAKSLKSIGKGLRTAGGRIIRPKGLPDPPPRTNSLSGSNGTRVSPLTSNTGNWRATSRTGKKKTVLGRGKDKYSELADELDANKFEIPAEEWELMSDAERWAANQEFLDDCIANGSDFEFATHSSGYWEEGWNGGTNYFKKEMDYLLNKGYKLRPDGFGLTK